MDLPALFWPGIFCSGKPECPVVGQLAHLRDMICIICHIITPIHSSLAFDPIGPNSFAGEYLRPSGSTLSHWNVVARVLCLVDIMMRYNDIVSQILFLQHRCFTGVPIVCLCLWHQRLQLSSKQPPALPPPPPPPSPALHVHSLFSTLTWFFALMYCNGNALMPFLFYKRLKNAPPTSIFPFIPGSFHPIFLLLDPISLPLDPIFPELKRSKSQSSKVYK